MVRPAGSERRLPPLTVMAWLRFDAIRRAIAAVAPRSVLELGCGEGAMGAWLAGRARYTVGGHVDTAGGGRVAKDGKSTR